MITKDITTLKINKLSEEQYQAAIAAGTINEDELYMTPDTNELDTHQFLRVSDVGSAVDPNPIDADTLGGVPASEYLTDSDIVDNLTTTDATKVLSASQGKSLQDSINSVADAVNLRATIDSPTFTGTPTTSANTNYTTAQLRNVIISTEDPSGGSNGDIWIKYTE